MSTDTNQFYLLYYMLANLEYLGQLILDALQAREQRVPTQYLYKDATNTPANMTICVKLKTLVFWGELTTCPAMSSIC